MTLRLDIFWENSVHTFLSIFSFFGRMRRMVYSLVVLVTVPAIFVMSLVILMFLLRDYPGHILEQMQQQADPAAAHVFDPVLQMPSAFAKATLVLSAVLLLVFYVALLASSIRRLHDMNVTGWVALVLVFAPWMPGIVFILIGLVLMLWPGSKGDNGFGPDPRSYPETEAAIGCRT